MNILKNSNSENKGIQLTKDFVDSLPSKSITITLKSKEWRELCDYVLWGIEYMKEEVDGGCFAPRSMLLLKRVIFCEQLRKHILERLTRQSSKCSMTLQLHEWNALRDCLWQGTTWAEEHNPKMQIGECIGYRYHNLIMEKARKCHQSMTPKEMEAWAYKTAFYCI